MTINKQALLDYLNTQFANTQYGAVSAKIKEIYNEVRSGRFESPSDDRLRAALEFYADPATYDIDHLNKHGYIIIDKDGGEIAREALGINSKEE